ncbi:MAG: signal recognition particle-docking protein FtsY [Aigarchaeota archaeon]|nr:signal recognition particle-docking protein FtsY [Aigarchaeota archaeon]MDW7985805.1 signal recognition particle-docking protein FtsY [Nitrososphaerota archaeon]
MLETLKKAFSGVIEKIKMAELSEKEIERFIEEFKLQLISSDVAVEVVDKLCERLSEELSKLKFKRFTDPSSQVKEIMFKIIGEVLPLEGWVEKILEMIEEKKRGGEPFVILFVGPNGGGKTTTVVKVAKFFKDRGYSSIIAASDTFRAGAIEQLKKLAESIKIRVVSQKYGADPAAVALDAVMSARSDKIPLVLIDTAGRTEVDVNLLEEMKKIKRVVKPDLVIYVGDALMGNVAVEQAKRFNEYVGIDYAILAKLDADARGGAALSISYTTGKPLLFVGIGQRLEDIAPFNREYFQRLLTQQ